MSAQETQEFADHMVATEKEHQRAERPVLERRYEPVAVEVEGRTVDVRVVPFGEVARVADPPDWTEYDEEWMPGVFDHQLKAPNRIHANYEHQKGINNVVGHGLSLRRESDGYHATLDIHPTQVGDTALALIRGGALPQVSLEAVAVKSVRTANGVLQRVKANLRGVGFCREGAFAGAQVLAVRNQDDEPEVIVDEAPSPFDIPAETVARCRRLGFALPQRYEAHPASTDTSSDEDTSDDDTRPPVGNPKPSEE